MPKVRVINPIVTTTPSGTRISPQPGEVVDIHEDDLHGFLKHEAVEHLDGRQDSKRSDDAQRPGESSKDAEVRREEAAKAAVEKKLK